MPFYYDTFHVDIKSSAYYVTTKNTLLSVNSVSKMFVHIEDYVHSWNVMS